jgi:hypothetical protein
MSRKLVCGLLLAAALPFLAAGPALAEGPVIERGNFQETFFDDYIFDLCGIATETTLTQRWSSKVYPDGSEVVHVVRTFVPADTRLPIEKGAATSFISPDGTRRVVGKPIHLIGPSGVRLLDAGWVEFDPTGEVSDIRGPHELLSSDPAEFYCPK